MKKCFLTLLSLFLLTCISCEKKIDINKEKEAIKALISNETEAYLRHDTVKLFSCYIHDQDQTRLAMQCDTINLYQGWDKISSLLKNADLTGFSDVKNTKDFINIKIMGDVAWAMYKDNWTAKRNEIPMNNTLYCTMILEKITGEWKISCFSLHVANN
jgi:hypothetical protein